jgi:hypothetical protein
MVSEFHEPDGWKSLPIHCRWRAAARRVEQRATKSRALPVEPRRFAGRRGLELASSTSCMAGSRGFEPPVSALTGPHVRPLHHEPLHRSAQREGF